MRNPQIEQGLLYPKTQCLKNCPKSLILLTFCFLSTETFLDFRLILQIRAQNFEKNILKFLFDFTNF